MLGFLKNMNRDNNNTIAELQAKIDELKQENAILKGIQLAMPDPYYVRDMDYNIILWPKAIQNLMGYSEDEAKKLKCYDIFKACVCPPDSNCPTQKCVLTQNFLQNAAVDVYKKDGSIVHTIVSNAGIYDEQGTPIGAVEIVKDNTSIQRLMIVSESMSRRLNNISEELVSSTLEVCTMADSLAKMKNENMEEPRATRL